MENKPHESGQEINADFKKHKGLHPDSRDVLEDDLVSAEEVSGDDGNIVKSSDPESQEWNARESVKEDGGTNRT